MSKVELHKKAELCKQAAKRSRGRTRGMWELYHYELRRMAARKGTIEKGCMA